ncbi:MAG: fused MFS/spermidine synthase [Planctomycetota bacterium]|jgi:spermidine synthase
MMKHVTERLFISDKGIRLILLMLFFLSGASALIYQIVWMRMFGFVFGVTIFAISTVLTAFMTGLALGSIYFGRLIDKRKNALTVFAFLELGIGLFALAFPLLFQGLNYIYVYTHQQLATSFYLSSLIRFAASFLFLLIPTTLMGGTLPVLSKFFIKKLKKLGWDIGHLYSVNNLGAVIGCFAAGFFLIQTAGLKATINIAAIINIVIAAVVFIMRRQLTAPQIAAESEDTDEVVIADTHIGAQESEAGKYPRYITHLVLWAFAIEGFSALSYEVIWTRILLGLSSEKSVYFFSTVIISFIFGLSLGSFIVAKFIDYKKNLLALFGFVEIAIGVLAILLLPVFALLPRVLLRMHPSGAPSWWSSTARECFIFFLVMLVPTTLMGSTFPIVSKIYTTSLKKLGKRIGNIGCLDTVGSIFGSFVAGFIFIPFAGVVKAVILTAVINLVLGTLLILFHPFMRYRAKLLTGLIFLCIMAATYFASPSNRHFRHWDGKRTGDKLLYYEEGASATVAVPQRRNMVKVLAINGAGTAFTDYFDLRVHKMLGYLPLLSHRNPKNALVIGLGMGVTAQSLIAPFMNEVDCAEICPEVIAAVKCFSKENRNVLENPKLKIVIEDGRNHLFITNKKYDIITSNAVHVRLSGNLYTKDFYEICKRKLNRDGIMCQWLPTNWLSESEYQMLVKSFMKVFPHTSLWRINVAHTILLGTPSKLQIDFESLTQKLQDEKTNQDLEEVNLNNPFALLAQYVSDEDNLTEYVRQVPLNTDDHPYVEFSKVADRRPNWFAIKSIFKMRKDVGDILVNVAETDDESAKVREKLDKYTLSTDHTLLAGLHSFYGMDIESVQETYQALSISPEYKHAKFTHNFFKSKFINKVKNYQAAGNLKQALRLCKKALEVDPHWPEALVQLGVTYYTMGMHHEAITTIKQAIQTAPDFVESYISLGVAYINKRMYDDAVIALQKAVKIDPNYPAAHYNLGTAYTQKGMFDEAISELEKTMQLAPDSIETRYRLATLYAKVGRYKEAKFQLKETLRLNPDFQPARSALKKLQAD